MKYEIDLKVKSRYTVEVTQEMIDSYRRLCPFERNPIARLTDLEIAEQIATEDYYDLDLDPDTDVLVLAAEKKII